MMPVQLKAWIGLLAAAAVLAVAHYNRGWPGFWLALGGIVFIVLLYVTRLLRVLRAVANRPQGMTSSAVMLHARLRPGMAVLAVVQLARAVGQPQGALGQRVETYRWSDPGGAWVDCQFANGRLQTWQLHRPPEPLPEVQPEHGQ